MEFRDILIKDIEEEIRSIDYSMSTENWPSIVQRIYDLDGIMNELGVIDFSDYDNLLFRLYEFEYRNDCYPKLTRKHYDYVDLGLPSGTLWATKNVGARNEMKDPGRLFGLCSGLDYAKLWMGSKWKTPKGRDLRELLDNVIVYADAANFYELVSKVNGRAMYIPKINGQGIIAGFGNITGEVYVVINEYGANILACKSGMYPIRGILETPF